MIDFNPLVTGLIDGFVASTPPTDAKEQLTNLVTSRPSVFKLHEAQRELGVLIAKNKQQASDKTTIINQDSVNQQAQEILQWATKLIKLAVSTPTNPETGCGDITLDDGQKLTNDTWGSEINLTKPSSVDGRKDELLVKISHGPRKITISEFNNDGNHPMQSASLIVDKTSNTLETSEKSFLALY